MSRKSPPPAPAVRVLGVLGGIASGKSAVARALAGERGVVLDADRLAREALESPAVVARLRERFGDAALGPDGRPDRPFLAARAFASADDRRALEGWTHPVVRARILAELEAARASGRSPVVLDVPLLLENDAQHGLAGLCDALIFVQTEESTRIARAAANRGWNADEIARREAAQWPLDEKRARADHVVINEGTPDELARQVRELAARLDLA